MTLFTHRNTPFTWSNSFSRNNFWLTKGDIAEKRLHQLFKIDFLLNLL